MAVSSVASDYVEKLRDMALDDAVPYVRDLALHALGCQRCKPEPLAVDVLDIVILRAKTEASWKKRPHRTSGPSQAYCWVAARSGYPAELL